MAHRAGHGSSRVRERPAAPVGPGGTAMSRQRAAERRDRPFDVDLCRAVGREPARGGCATAVARAGRYTVRDTRFPQRGPGTGRYRPRSSRSGSTPRSPTAPRRPGSAPATGSGPNRRSARTPTSCASCRTRSRSGGAPAASAVSRNVTGVIAGSRRRLARRRPKLIPGVFARAATPRGVVWAREDPVNVSGHRTSDPSRANARRGRPPRAPGWIPTVSVGSGPSRPAVCRSAQPPTCPGPGVTPAGTPAWLTTCSAVWRFGSDGETTSVTVTVRMARATQAAVMSSNRRTVMTPTLGCRSSASCGVVPNGMQPRPQTDMGRGWDACTDRAPCLANRQPTIGHYTR